MPDPIPNCRWRCPYGDAKERARAPARRRLLRRAIVATACALAVPAPLAAPAQSTTVPQSTPAPATSSAHTLSTVVVTATQTPEPEFYTPTAVSVIASGDVVNGPPGVSLAQTLARVPGLVAQNRQSYAQDLQISSRGFGARASFGVRGIRLLIDGVPASGPDGQGETDMFDLASIQRIEVLRGPFSALYGNASGGVIQVFTKDGPPQPTLTGETMFGSYGTRIRHMEFGGTSGKLNYMLDGTHFETHGYREHSAARRDNFMGKFTYDLGKDSSLMLLVNGEDQPHALDPSSLNAEQVKVDPTQAVDNVFRFNAGEKHRDVRSGLVWRQQVDANDRLYVMGWTGHRRVLQFLPFGGGDPLGGGAVVDLHNRMGGGDVHWTREGSIGASEYTVTGGASHQRLHEKRRGYVNDDGAAGDLRRHEDDVSTQSAVYAQGQIVLAPWRLFAGVRRTRVRIDSHDHYITTLNPDDSGVQVFSRTTPVVGVLYQASPSLNLYANYGAGFQTPALAELAYKPGGGTGFNRALMPSTSHNYEIGFKARPRNRAQISLALYDIKTADEIVVAGSQNGRTSFDNAGRTRRIGTELSFDSPLGGGFAAYAAYTWLKATFTGARLDGNRLPGVPRQTLYAELNWKYDPLGFNAAVDTQWRGKVFVDSANSQAAAGYAVVNLRAGFHQAVGAWRLEEYAHVNNVFDRRYVGAVVVESGNGRFYGPAPERNYLVGASVTYAF